MAEKLGLGFIDHGRFVKKPNVVIASRLSSLPRINEKSLDGKISHVSISVPFSWCKTHKVTAFSIDFSLKTANVFGFNRHVKTTEFETF